MYDEAGGGATERIRELELRLQEAEETLEAIRTGKVDALVVAGPEGDAVYSLQGADYPYRIIVEQMAEGAVTIIEDGTVLYGNHRLSEMLGQTAGGLAGKSFSSFVSAEDQDTFRQLMLDPCGRRHEMRLVTGGGTKLPVYLSAGTIELEEQKVVCLVVTDLTAQKRLEEQLRQSQNMQAIGTFAGGIAHDFNNILAIIMGNAEMAVDDPGESRRNEEQILKVSKRGERAGAPDSRIQQECPDREETDQPRAAVGGDPWTPVLLHSGDDKGPPGY
jgi:PAS domain S-box-containing protein